MPETIEIPDLLPYPTIQPFEDVPELHNRFVYVIKKYEFTGYSILMVRDKGYIVSQIADFDGNKFDGDRIEEAESVLSEKFHTLSALVSAIKIDKCICYLSEDKDDIKLVDVRLSYNKFVGPGFIKDVFGNTINTQDIHKILQLDESIVESMMSGKNNYDGEYIVKSSAYKFMERDGNFVPMYGLVSR